MSVTFTSDRPEQVGLIDLFRDLFQKTGELFQIQVDLVKAEAKIESRKLLLILAWGMVFLTVVSFFLLFLGVSMVLLLAQVMSYMWATVITTGFFLLLTIISGLVIVYVLKRNSASVNV